MDGTQEVEVNCKCVSCAARDAERKAAGKAWDAKYAGKGNNLAMGYTVGQAEEE